MVPLSTLHRRFTYRLFTYRRFTYRPSKDAA